MAKFNNKYRIKSARCQSWDYASPGSYFVTIITSDRNCLFGDILDEQVRHNELGKIAIEEWLKTPVNRKKMNLELGEFVVMPNHLHGIITIGENQYNRNLILLHEAVELSKTFKSPTNNLSSIIRGFKSSVTSKARKLNSSFGWQERFHDHIIRDNDEYERISKYIRDNPKRWKNF